MLQASETWPVRKENEVALQRAEMRIVRWMCNVKVKLKGFLKLVGFRQSFPQEYDNVFFNSYWHCLYAADTLVKNGA